MYADDVGSELVPALGGRSKHCSLRNRVCCFYVVCIGVVRPFGGDQCVAGGPGARHNAQVAWFTRKEHGSSCLIAR